MAAYNIGVIQKPRRGVIYVDDEFLKEGCGFITLLPIFDPYAIKYANNAVMNASFGDNFLPIGNPDGVQKSDYQR